MPLTIGAVINGRYRIDVKLGEGGMGAVYRAFDLLHDQPCALKGLRLDDLPTEDEVRRADGTRPRAGRETPPVTREKAAEQFRREARLLAALAHPNLPKVTDYFEAGDGYFLVMTLIEGQNLAEVLDRAGGRPLPESQVLGWIGQVTDALAYCHAGGIIHRDVKPGNMIVTGAGKVYLVDFGIAKPDCASGQTTIGARATTPGYSPPEQYGGQAHTDARSDIYALGATLYALLTGHDPVEAVDRLQGREMPAPRSLVPAISERVDVAVTRALALRPEERFQSVPELRTALSLPPTVAPAEAAREATTPAGLAIGPVVPEPPAVAAPLVAPAAAGQPPKQAVGVLAEAELARLFDYALAAGRRGLWREAEAALAEVERRRPGYARGGLRAADLHAQAHARLLSAGQRRRVAALVIGGAIFALLIGAALFVNWALSGGEAEPTTPAAAQAQATTARGAQATLAAAPPSKPAAPAQATPVVSLSTASAWPLVVYDSFDSNDYNWLTGDEAGELSEKSLSITGGKLRWQVKALASLLTWDWPIVRPVSDFYASVLAKKVSGPDDADYGLFFSDGDNRYFFEVGEDGFFALHSRSGEDEESQVLVGAESSPAVRPGEENRLTVIATQGQLLLFINGELVGQAPDGRTGAGQVGPLVGLSEGDEAVFEFDDFELRAP